MTELLAGLVPGAKVVKGFNQLQVYLLAGDPRQEGGRRVLFYFGDEAQAKAEVAGLVDRIGLFGIDLGSSAAASPSFLAARCRRSTS